MHFGEARHHTRQARGRERGTFTNCLFLPPLDCCLSAGALHSTQHQDTLALLPCVDAPWSDVLREPLVHSPSPRTRDASLPKAKVGLEGRREGL